MRENDVFVLEEPLQASIIGNHDAVMLPVGTVVTVVHVFGEESSPQAYEVEAFLSDINAYALATFQI